MPRRLKCFVLIILRFCGVFALAKSVARNKLRILCYHGFALADEIAWRPELFIGLPTFRRRLDWLQQNGFTVVPLSEALESLDSGRIPMNACVITIDDGFYSTKQLAIPELRARNLAVTVYVTTYYVEKDTPIFRLSVQYMFWKSRKKTLELFGMPCCSGQTVDLTDAAACEAAMQKIICEGEASLSHKERQVLARELGERLGVDYDGIAESRIVSLMRGEEIASLAAAGVDIQLHTHRHTLSADDRNSVTLEITDNRRILEPLVGRTLKHFCYPRGEWVARQWPWLEELGIRSATTCISGMNNAGTPRFCLRRFLDSEDVSEIEFEAEMVGILDLVRAVARRVGIRD